MTPNQQLPQLGYIQRIQAEKLFGQFDHDLNFGSTPPSDPNLLILYGENGTGKTTLLWLVFHLLNNRPAEGHRTYLARQRFKKISVTFSDGTEISAERPAAGIGDFRMDLSWQSERISSFTFKTEPPSGKIPNLSDDKLHSEFMDSLPSFSFGFLPHDRLTRSGQEFRTLQFQLMISEGISTKSEQKSPIEVSIAKAISTARQKTIRASNQGQFSANAIYAELVQRIAQVQLTAESRLEEQRRDLLQRLKHQAKLTREYSKFGLISELQVEALSNTVQAIPFDRLVIVIQVLEPFLHGNEARLEALAPLHIALTAMVETVNSLFLNKQIILHLEKGLQISTLTDERLVPDQLSSGEQELLILFCEVISALEPNTILFVDEPELSLNVSWQKDLLSALLRCASGSKVQFVIATHSIELLTHHRANVTRLSNRIVGSLKPSADSGEKTES